MQKYQNSIQDVKGNAVAGASVAVYVYNTLTLATIYSDNGVTPIPPGSLLSNSEGEFAFYAANGRYNIQIIATGLISQTTYDVLLFDPEDAGITSVKDFGAVGDGVTNDTAAIQLAIDTIIDAGGGTVLFPTGQFKVTSLVIDSGVYLQGEGSKKRSSQHMSEIVGTAGYDVITCANKTMQDFAIRHLTISGGRRSFYYNPSANDGYITNFEIYDVCFNIPTSECIYIGGQAERLRFSYIYFAGGTYGYYHGVGATGRAYGFFEKSTWEHCYFEGQSINAIFYDDMYASGSTTYNFLKVISSGQDAIKFKGNVGGITFINLLFENCATSGPTAASTTGSMTAGSPTLTVASGTNFVNGQNITVSGAGLYDGVIAKSDLNTTIVSGGGTTTLTLAANAAYSGSSMPVTNRKYDLVVFEATADGGAQNVNFIGCYLSDGFAKTRYTVNNGSGGELCVLSSWGDDGGYDGKPIFDPWGRVSVFNGSTGIRTSTVSGTPFSSYTRGQTSVIPNGNYRGATAEQPPTVIGSAPGMGVYSILNDSTSSGSGTLGNWAIYVSTPNFDRVVNVDPANYRMQTRYRFAIPGYGGSTGSGILSESDQYIAGGNAPPSAGTWGRGSVVYSAVATVGSPIGWMCTVAGTPGTWVAMANL